MNENLEETCEFLIDIEGEPFCRREYTNLNIEPCSPTCPEYIRGLYQNINDLADEVCEYEVVE